jgi:hypothetical protein
MTASFNAHTIFSSLTIQPFDTKRILRCSQNRYTTYERNWDLYVQLQRTGYTCTLKWGDNVDGFLCTKPYGKTVPLRIAANPVVQNDGYPNFLEIQDYAVDKENARD